MALALRRKRTRQPSGRRLAVDRDLAGKRRVRLAPEEVQNLGGTQRGDRGGHQIALDRLQRRALGKQDVAGVFALVDHPPVAGKAGVRDGGQQRIDQGRLALQERRPVSVGEPLAQRRDRLARSSTAVILLSLRRYPMPPHRVAAPATRGH